MAGPRTSIGGMLFVLASSLACLYVAGRLWNTTRELHYLQTELQLVQQSRKLSVGRGSGLLPLTDSNGDSTNADIRTVQGSDDVLYYSVRSTPSGGPRAPPLTGPKIESDLPTQEWDERLLGQIDSVEAGTVSGWACLRGQLEKPLQVVLYVDGVRIGEAAASGDTPHHIIHRLCEIDMDMAGDMQQPAQQGVGFTLKLPELQQGRHEIRAFVSNPHSTSKQELNQSPLAFLETASEPGLEEALKRKDNIIRVRNAQISALWDELHTRQPWKNAIKGEDIVSFPEDAANTTRKLAVLGINTGMGARLRRDNLRRTWVPMGKDLKRLEEERGIVIRFVIGYSEQKDDPDEVKLKAEMQQFGDIVRIDMVDTYADLSMKTLRMFSILPQKIDADFYFKIDDDVAVNVDALADYLDAHRTQGNLYLGCMKSGQVLTDRRYKWFEPEYWRFGEAAGAEGQINYMRHASGQIYGLSGPVAKYIGRNGPILHRFANEDVTLGAWLVGLEITHVDERRMCCDSAEKCNAQTGDSNMCLAYYEHQCAGICSSEERLEPIYEACLRDPLKKGQNARQAAIH